MLSDLTSRLADHVVFSADLSRPFDDESARGQLFIRKPFLSRSQLLIAALTETVWWLPLWMSSASYYLVDVVVLPVCLQCFISRVVEPAVCLS